MERENKKKEFTKNKKEIQNQDEDEEKSDLLNFLHWSRPQSAIANHSRKLLLIYFPKVQTKLSLEIKKSLDTY